MPRSPRTSPRPATTLICYEPAAALAEPADVVAIEHKMAGVRQLLAGWGLDDGGARSAELQPQVGTLTEQVGTLTDW